MISPASGQFSLIKVFFYTSLPVIALFLAPDVRAQVIINEVSPADEWIELFKTAAGPVSLDGCILYFHSPEASAADKQSKPLTGQDSFLDSEEYKVIYSGENWLNNSGDSVYLDCPDFDDGPYTYDGSFTSGQSYARVPNGGGNFTKLAVSSPGAANPDPTPAPTNSPAQTPLATPKPTSSPTPLPTAVLVKPSPKTTATPEPIAANKDKPIVLGTTENVKEEREEETEDAGDSAGMPAFAILFIAGGGFLCLGAVYMSIIKRKNEENSPSD